MTVQWIEQEDPHGCGVAALAMILGRTYAEVKAMLSAQNWQREGATIWVWDALLANEGYAVARKYRHDAARDCMREVWPPEPFAPIHLCLVRYPRFTRGHMVVLLADGTVLDPLTPEPRTLDWYDDVDHVAGIARLDWVEVKQPSPSPHEPARAGGENATTT